MPTDLYRLLSDLNGCTTVLAHLASLNSEVGLCHDTAESLVIPPLSNSTAAAYYSALLEHSAFSLKHASIDKFLYLLYIEFIFETVLPC